MDFPFPVILNKDGTIKQVVRGTWDRIENHKIFIDWLFKKLECRSEEDFYKLTKQIFVDNYGHGLLKNKYNSSPYLLLTSLYPNYNWLPWLFRQTPDIIWEDFKYHKIYAKWLGEILEYTNPEDWYGISKTDFIKNKGFGLLQGHYDSSFRKFLKKIFPEYEWLEWRFTQTAKGYFDTFDNHTKFVEYLKQKLNYKTNKDWYKLSSELIHKYGGGGLIYTHYQNSVYKFLTKLIPDYKFLPWKFKCSYRGLWENIETHKDYANWLYTELGYTSMDDWYKTCKSNIENNYGGGLLTLYYQNSPKIFVMSIYSDYNWVKSKFQKHYSKGEIEWLEYLKVSIPDIRHALNHVEGQYRIPNSKYVVDGYSQIKTLICEYNGDNFHGNPNKFRKSTYPHSYIQLNPDEIFPLCKKTYSELYTNTMKKKEFCEDAGYNYYSIWESDWHSGIRALIKIQRMYKNEKYQILLENE
jgi:hypothetical protein